MRRLKIAIVANSCWNIYNFRLELIRHFKMAGHEIIVIAPVDEYIYYLNENYFTKHIPIQHLDSQHISPLWDIMFFRELYNIYKTESPDLILQFTIKPNIYGSIAAKFLGIKCISTLTGLGSTFGKWKFEFILKALYKFALSRNKKIGFHNRDDLNLFVDLKLVDVSKAIVIPGSGVDTNKFKKQLIVNKSEHFVFLFVGRLLKDKGLVEFVKAAIEARSIVKSAEFWVIGEYNPFNPNSVDKNDLLDWIESRIIKYHGYERDVRKYLNKADVVVLPSYREGLPRAILEAMSMERPIITTDVPGCRDLVKNGWNGLLVPSKNIHQLAEAMVSMYNFNDEHRLLMGKNSRQLVLEKFDLNIILHAYDDLIEELFGTEMYSQQKFS